MKTLTNITLVATALTLLLSSNTLQAQEQKRERKSVVIKFNRLDTDSSGGLSLAELTANLDNNAAKRLEKLDTDASGTINLDEYLTGKRHTVDLSSFAGAIVQCVQDIKDETGNENILVPSADKFAAPQDKFTALDTDASGDLDIDEVIAAMNAHAHEKFTLADIDMSSEISLEEWFNAHKMKKATGRAVKACIDEVVDDSDPV